MKIAAKLDISVLKKNLDANTKKTVSGVAKALNNTMLDVQQAERVQLDQKFTVRKAAFMYRLIKMTAFASGNKARPYAELAIDNTKARVLLPLFQDGGEKDPQIGKTIAVPVTGEAARPSFGQLVPDALTFQGLQFKRMNLTKAGRQALASKKKFGVGGKLSGDYYIWAGQQRTFILQQTAKLPQGGVFQRTGPKPGDLQLLYKFEGPVKLKAAFDFIGRAQEVIAEKWPERFAEVFGK